MAILPTKLDHLVNPLVTVDQLPTSSSSIDGITPDLEASVRYAALKLTQAAGVLLRLPQDTIAQAIVLFTRFWVGPEGGSLAVHAAKDVSAASIYLSAKLSFSPTSPRSVLNVYAFLLSNDTSPLSFINPGQLSDAPVPEAYYVSEGQYQSGRNAIMKMESMILHTLGFQTHVALPHTIALTYLQTLGTASPSVSRRAFEHLNAALFSPQLLYLAHQPNALAVAAIYLAARERGAKLVDSEWWEVFDVDREELGFLVVAMRSMENFTTLENEKWKGRRVPMTVAEVDKELKRLQVVEDGK